MGQLYSETFVVDKASRMALQQKDYSIKITAERLQQKVQGDSRSYEVATGTARL